MWRVDGGGKRRWATMEDYVADGRVDIPLRFSGTPIPVFDLWGLAERIRCLSQW